MKNENLVFLLKYASSYSILIVNENNELLELKCPFKVLARYSNRDLLKNSVYLVKRLKLSENHSLVYLINNQYFHYYHFEIIT